MKQTLNQQLSALQRKTVSQLRETFAEVFGEKTKAGHRDWLIRRIAWRLQANEQGGLSERARQRAMQLANDSDLRLSPPKSEPVAKSSQTFSSTISHRDPRLPAPGTIVTRQYKGAEIRVTVLADGFEFRGDRYTSLSAIAKLITGSHMNGFAFFKLTTSCKEHK